MAVPHATDHLLPEPELPQDEAGAALLNRSTDNLGFLPARPARGGSGRAPAAGTGLLEQPAQPDRLDDLDIIPPSRTARPRVRGRYLSQNVYVDVQTGSDGVSRVQVNLDINKVRLRPGLGRDRRQYHARAVRLRARPLTPRPDRRVATAATRGTGVSRAARPLRLRHPGEAGGIPERRAGGVEIPGRAPRAGCAARLLRGHRAERGSGMSWIAP